MTSPSSSLTPSRAVVVIDLNKATDDDICTAIAQHVAGWTQEQHSAGHVNGQAQYDYDWTDPHGVTQQLYRGPKSDPSGVPDYLTDLVAVMDLLDALPCHWLAEKHAEGYQVVAYDDRCYGHPGQSPTLCRAACISLLRAAGVTVIDKA